MDRPNFSRRCQILTYSGCCQHASNCLASGDLKPDGTHYDSLTCRQNAWKFLPNKSEGQKNLGISWGQGILETETCENQTSTVVKCPSDAWFWIFASRCPAWSAGSVWHQKCHSALRPLNLTRPCDQVSCFRPSTTKIWPLEVFFGWQTPAASQIVACSVAWFSSRRFKWDNQISRLGLISE